MSLIDRQDIFYEISCQKGMQKIPDNHKSNTERRDKGQAWDKSQTLHNHTNTGHRDVLETLMSPRLSQEQYQPPSIGAEEGPTLAITVVSWPITHFIK